MYVPLAYLYTSKIYIITGPCTLETSLIMDREYLVRHAMTTGYQWSSLVVPPVYVVYVLARRGRAALSINRVLRASWVGGLSGKSASIC